jgi:hypothetical protein
MNCEEARRIMHDKALMDELFKFDSRKERELSELLLLTKATSKVDHLIKDTNKEIDKNPKLREFLTHLYSCANVED